MRRKGAALAGKRVGEGTIERGGRGGNESQACTKEHKAHEKKNFKHKMAKLVFKIIIMTFNGQKERARKRREIGDKIERKKKQ